MALIKCPECSKSVSDKAKFCPHCGYPIDEYVKGNPKKDILSDIKSILEKLKEKLDNNNLKKSDILFDKLKEININDLSYDISDEIKSYLKEFMGSNFNICSYDMGYDFDEIVLKTIKTFYNQIDYKEYSIDFGNKKWKAILFGPDTVTLISKDLYHVSPNDIKHFKSGGLYNGSMIKKSLEESILDSFVDIELKKVKSVNIKVGNNSSYEKVHIPSKEELLLAYKDKNDRIFDEYMVTSTIKNNGSSYNIYLVNPWNENDKNKGEIVLDNIPSYFNSNAFVTHAIIVLEKNYLVKPIKNDLSNALKDFINKTDFYKVEASRLAKSGGLRSDRGKHFILDVDRRVREFGNKINMLSDNSYNQNLILLREMKNELNSFNYRYESTILKF